MAIIFYGTLEFDGVKKMKVIKVGFLDSGRDDDPNTNWIQHAHRIRLEKEGLIRKLILILKDKTSKDYSLKDPKRKGVYDK